MCGIVGRVGGRAPSEDDAAYRMVHSLAHRGPDEQRVVALDGAVFGTARLAMVDRPTSVQPLTDGGGGHLVAFNGEIYNYRQLREELINAGFTFGTSGDTEVVLSAMVHWGADALARLKGQFALAYWDARRRQLILARDRFGIVPLFFTQPGRDELAFASEVKALRAGGWDTPLAVADVVDTAVFWGVHPGRSPFSGVHSVEPGTCLVWRDGVGRQQRYWRMSFSTDRDRQPMPQLAEKLGSLLATAVQRRIPQYDDPAVLLSGGLDSTAVLATLRTLRPEDRVASYSIQFARNALDESDFQRLAVQRFHTDHRAIVCDDETVAEALVETIRHTEAPLVRTAAATSIRLAAAIEADGMRCVLSGEGADEFLCGYDLFKIARIRDTWAGEPDSTALTSRLEEVMSQQRELGRAVERAFYEQGVDHRGDPLFSHLNRWAASYRLTQYLNSDIRATLVRDEVFERARRLLPADYHEWGVVEQAQYLEVTYFLATTLLGSQCDRPYMAHSVEARYPFLDEDLVDFALRLPVEAKLDGMNEKAVLKAAMADMVPPQIRERVKQPYTAPEGDVFRSGSGRALLEQYAAPEALTKTGLFDPKRVSWLLAKLGRARTSFHDDLAVLWIVSTQVLASTYGVAHP